MADTHGVVQAVTQKPTLWESEPGFLQSLAHINWQALLEIAFITKKALASEAEADELTCQWSDEYAKGSKNLVRQVLFSDGCIWVARLPVDEGVENINHRYDLESYILKYLERDSSLPTPKIFKCGIDASGVGAPFMLLELLAFDNLADKMVRAGGKVPEERMSTLLLSMAKVQVVLAQTRFFQMGKVVRKDDGSYGVGRHPVLGGPFDNCVDFFKAWIAAHHFKPDETQKLRGDDFYEYLRHGGLFPEHLMNFIKSTKFRDGPWPLIHASFHQGNLLVNDKFEVCGLIDFERAWVGPWELIDLFRKFQYVPERIAFFQRRPKSFHRFLPEYVRAVKTAELEMGTDNKVSSVLTNSAVLDFNQAIRD